MATRRKSHAWLFPTNLRGPVFPHVRWYIIATETSPRMIQRQEAGRNRLLIGRCGLISNVSRVICVQSRSRLARWRPRFAIGVREHDHSCVRIRQVTTPSTNVFTVTTFVGQRESNSNRNRTCLLPHFTVRVASKDCHPRLARSSCIARPNVSRQAVKQPANNNPNNAVRLAICCIDQCGNERVFSLAGMSNMLALTLRRQPCL